MKKLIFAFLALIFIAGSGASSFALPLDNQQLPMDTAIRHGILPNGLTYYIRHNEEPKNRADFYIAQKVGSILENDNQRGLAHFLEHMAFNGTTHFPDKNMLEYLQNNGMRFGYDINAYTGLDQTVYYISNVPTNKDVLMDSVMLALYDWGSEISLKTEEIDKERGVINEEWRTRGDAQMRMLEKVLPIMYKGSKYANRLPIGSMDIVMNFKPEELKAYYEAWYRPDQQGIIIIGDFDAAKMEQKVIALFSKATMPANAQKREYFPVTDNKKPIYTLYTDPEAASTDVYLFFKHNQLPKAELSTMKKYRRDALNILTQIMLAERFNEIAQKPDAPYNNAFGYDGEFFISKTKDAYTLIGQAKEGKSLETLASLLTEAQRVHEHGFTASELNRAKAQLATSIQNQYSERNKMRNSKYAQEYVDHFTNGGAVAGIEFDYVTIKELLPLISLKDMNDYFIPMITKENIVMGIFGPEKASITYPTEKEVMNTFKDVLSHKTTAYIDNVSNMPLISKEPIPGKITNEKYDKATGITELNLSNGATVYLKPTNFRNDEISMTGISFGGKWAYKGDKALQLKALEPTVEISALGNYTRTDLRKYMADKKATVSFVVGEPTENVSGSCVTKDLETMLQLNYLYFTDIRKDDEAFKAMTSRLKSELSLQNNNPQQVFSDSINSSIFPNMPLYKSLQPEEVDLINYDEELAIARERLSNAGDFRFSFVGNFTVDSIKPFIEQYIASLPDNGSREKTDYKVGIRSGKHATEFKLGMEIPKTSSFTIVSGSLPYSTYNDFMLDMLDGIMDIVYTNTIREEEGGTYGVNTSASLSMYNNQWSFSYGFDTNPEAQKRLNERALKELKDVMNNGAMESVFNKVKEASIKQYEMSLLNNRYWMSVLRNKGIGNDIYTGYSDMIKNVTLNEFNSFIKKLNNTENTTTIVMDGVAK
ncbi:MAG: insulinase family protein [Muribaculaceae bacterium]